VLADDPLWYKDAIIYQAHVKAFADSERSAFRGRRHGAPARDVPGERYVVAAQNHDQVGNRARGERLISLAGPAGARLAAAAVLLTPFVPLLFMGDEHGEAAPFLYFVSHGDPALVDAVRRGRREEFAAFAVAGEPPDPAAEETYIRSKLDRTRAETPDGRAFLALHRELIRLRRERPALARLDLVSLEATPLEREEALVVRRRAGDDEVALVLRFARAPAALAVPLPSGRWRRLLDTEEARFGGAGPSCPEAAGSDGALALAPAARSAVLLARGSVP
jgi:maltooligosyltrehalose trehalohydrolase